jgi:hypothetical protein
VASALQAGGGEPSGPHVILVEVTAPYAICPYRNLGARP